jgi:hypothetical protein
LSAHNAASGVNREIILKEEGTSNASQATHITGILERLSNFEIQISGNVSIAANVS